MGATVGGHRLERAGHWRTSSHPEGRQTYSLGSGWTQGQRTPGVSRERLFSGWRQKILWEKQVSLGLGRPPTDLASSRTALT